MERPNNSINLIIKKVKTYGKRESKIHLPAEDVKNIRDYIYDLEQRNEALQKENTCLSLFAK